MAKSQTERPITTKAEKQTTIQTALMNQKPDKDATLGTNHQIEPPTLNSKPVQPWPLGRISLWILALIVAALLIFGIGLYGFGWRGQAAQRVVSLVPYPVAMVDARLIRFSTYQADFNTLKYFYTKQAELNATLFTMPDDQSIRAQLIDKLIRDAMTEKLARQSDARVSSTEIDAELQKIIDQTGNQADVESNIRELYDWDLTTFKEKVIRPYLVRSRLQEKLMADEAVNGEAHKRAQTVLAQIKASPETFEDIAKASSEDETTAANGGDLGYFGPNELVEEFETAAQNMDIGQISDLVQTPYGYHIIKLVDKTTGSDGQPSYRASHILTRTKDLDTWIGEKLQAATVWLFAPGFNWDKAAAQVALPQTSIDESVQENANASANTNS